MMLCDAAQEVGGKLYVIGGGWTNLVHPDMPASIAVAAILHVDWNETNSRHLIELELQTDEGVVFEVEDQPVRISTTLEAGRPAGIKPGSEINAPLASSFHGLSLPGGGYVWVLRNRDTVLARCPFQVGSRQ